MNYLTQRKVLHGDLAARNVLLCENNIVKICDFGLAKALQNSDNYRKKRHSALPIKWLAIETITDLLFSTYSDIWAYGVFLWELYSLAKSPYPGIPVDDKFCKLLENGYRMEKPNHANEEIFEIMLSCWKYRPDTRPSFDELEKMFAKMVLETKYVSYYSQLIYS